MFLKLFAQNILINKGFIENKIKLKLKLREQGKLEWRKSLSGSNIPGLCG